METVKFLGDIDSDKLYAAKLELAYNCAYQEILKILIDFPEVPDIELFDDRRLRQGDLLHASAHTAAQLEQMRVVMVLQIRQMAERKRRLADVAVGLADRVLDEEST